mmetsp:Transcript_44400/g.115398  ORF Transcript_44400/g.115398 Transcript_44400/m.115398 type:complete len:91 (-) Transcript_44400:834-1106(-)
MVPPSTNEETLKTKVKKLRVSIYCSTPHTSCNITLFGLGWGAVSCEFESSCPCGFCVQGTTWYLSWFKRSGEREEGRKRKTNGDNNNCVS